MQVTLTIGERLKDLRVERKLTLEQLAAEAVSYTHLDVYKRQVQLIGRPVAMMNKDDKVKSIRFLNDAGAMLITKSGDKIAKYFGISKYTPVSYTHLLLRAEPYSIPSI